MPFQLSLACSVFLEKSSVYLIISSLNMSLCFYTVMFSLFFFFNYMFFTFPLRSPSGIPIILKLFFLALSIIYIIFSLRFLILFRFDLSYYIFKYINLIFNPYYIAFKTCYWNNKFLYLYLNDLFHFSHLIPSGFQFTFPNHFQS